MTASTDKATDRPLFTIQFTLKTLLVLMLLVCCSLGAYSLGRTQGRKDAEPEIRELNQECGDLMHRAYLYGGTITFPLGGQPDNRVYDFNKPEDRKAYRDKHAQTHPLTY